MSNTKIVRHELTQYAQQIENLAKQVQTQLAQGGNILGTANELVRNTSTFVFVFGELSALESRGKKTVSAKTVSNPNGTHTRSYTNNHSLRDPITGRFVRV